MRAAALCVLVMIVSIVGASSSVLSYVNPFIGSGGEGYGYAATPPGAQLPFSNARVSPDTVPSDGVWLPFNHFGGYHYHDEVIRVFSHTHAQGAGGLAYGLVSTMPWIGQMDASVALKRYFFKQHFSHAEEHASPGYYSVLLEGGTQVELTAGKFSAVHRFSFPGGAPANVLFPVHGISDSSVAWQVASVSECTVSGQIFQNKEMPGRFGGIHVHFHATFDTACSSWGTWDHGAENSGAWVTFPQSVSGVQMKLAFSYINSTVALQNMPQGDFDETRKQAEALWSSALSQVSVQDGNLVDKTKFYTALYHSLCAPSTFSESGGLYRGFDNQTHRMEQGSVFYSDMSIWDIFRTQVPLLTLLRPTVARDMMRSLVLMYKQGGDMPRWPMAHGYTGSMDGQHADYLLLHAFVNGVSGFNVSAAYEGMRQGAVTVDQKNAGRHDLEDYMKLGYVPWEYSTHGACFTLEQAYDDWAVGEMATLLGKTADAAFFKNRSNNFLNVWNAKEHIFCPKTRAGKWECPLTKLNVFDKRYVEGDAWHYRFYAPHAMEKLISLYGGVDHFTSLVEEFFALSRLDPETLLPNPFIWIGNEPSELPAALAFAHVNRTDLVQKYSHMLMREDFSISPDGIPGNDDYGAISSWYAWGALGLYPNPGTTRYALGSPLFNASIALESGETISLVKYGPSQITTKILVNGKPVTSAWIDHATLVAGAKLEFYTQ